METKYFFKDEKHVKLYRNFRRMINDRNSEEYDSAVYLLAAVGKTIPASIFESGIDFPELFQIGEVWSSGEKALLRLAATLFSTGTWQADIGDIFYHLDPENCQVAIQALEIRYLCH